jgi:hypothetical protein
MYKNTKSSHKFVQKAIVPRAALPNTVFTEEECSFSFKFSRNVKPNLKIQNPHIYIIPTYNIGETITQLLQKHNSIFAIALPFRFDNYHITFYANTTNTFQSTHFQYKQSI